MSTASCPSATGHSQEEAVRAGCRDASSQDDPFRSAPDAAGRFVNRHVSRGAIARAKPKVRTIGACHPPEDAPHQAAMKEDPPDANWRRPGHVKFHTRRK